MSGRRQSRERGPAKATTRLVILGILLIAGFSAIGAQTVRLAVSRAPVESVSLAESVHRSTSRPDIVDREGRLLAIDVAKPSLYVDPLLVRDRDEVVERLAAAFPDLDERDLLRQIADERRRFLWVKRALPPAVAQTVHDMGLPGIGFRYELQRIHPNGRTMASVLGSTNIDNRGQSGIERHIDELGLSELVVGTTPSRQAPVRLTLDLAVQHAVQSEAEAAMQRYRAKGTAAVVLEAATGEVRAAVSISQGTKEGAAAPDRLMGGVYELGSILKAFTLAMALDSGRTTLETIFDARQPLAIGGRTINDYHGQKRLMTAREVFTHSSNIGAGQMALGVGAKTQRAFLTRAGLLEELATEAGTAAAPLLPSYWGETETATIGFGHGLAVSPLQLAAAAAALVNGGLRVRPTFVAAPEGPRLPAERVVSEATSRQIRGLMREVVAAPKGTGRRAHVEGLDIGGKTGTAEIARAGGYAERSVIASFLAAFPITSPRYVTLLVLFEPEPTIETMAQISAGHNAAPASGRMIARIAPLLGLMPSRQATAATFDARHERQ